jgi:hypothetical protein
MKDQLDMSEWLGYSVYEMNRDHDRLHAELCKWLGIESQALRVARGDKLSHEEHCLANWEEDAVLYLQRFIARAGVDMPNRFGYRT